MYIAFSDAEAQTQATIRSLEASIAEFHSEIEVGKSNWSLMSLAYMCFPCQAHTYDIGACYTIARIQINPDPKWAPKSRLCLYGKSQI